jgi:aspartyl-tRNA(Asn)/glutamyl-tRNA(Gln) amidotransferase subunit C
MKIDKEVVLHIAKLARLELKDEEVLLFTAQLENILQYVEKLGEIKQPVKPFSFDEYLPSITRTDEIGPCLSEEDALRNAPERVKNFFKVPRILP